MWANRGRTEVDEDEDDDADGMSYRTLGVAVPRTIQQRLIVGEYMNTPEDQSYRKRLGNAIRVIAEKAEHSNCVEDISAKQWVFKALADNKDKMTLSERELRGRRRKSDDTTDKKYGSSSVYWVGFTPFQ